MSGPRSSQRPPDLNAPFIGSVFCRPDGSLTQQAQAFLHRLWERTGYAPGVAGAWVQQEADNATLRADTANVLANVAGRDATQAINTATQALSAAWALRREATAALAEAQAARTAAEAALLEVTALRATLRALERRCADAEVVGALERRVVMTPERAG
ncbi:hypothetical protein [Oecophyllibacter saccharovorans]|uniref:hypothetical protein n=1 Tax=Oecophyllibacter saccharovorans TaxID=2558360 RepID=UPI0011715E74|nr:hypothetical protein [Oecophyllibacter saccharovorans]TPW36595.1 hypothetical protein E3203_02195 [Oecophyllibacter saccharovorans]